MIAIVNYDTGNICSVTNALKRVGCTDWVYTDDKEILMKADKVLLPGVGEASTAMAKLAERGLDAFIPTLTQPVLGICVGTQLMCQSSEEGDVDCMGIFRTKVKKFLGQQSKLRLSESKDCLQALPSIATSTKLIFNSQFRVPSGWHLISHISLLFSDAKLLHFNLASVLNYKFI